MGDPVAEVKYLEGKIVSMRAKTHRHQEWLKFVKPIEGLSQMCDLHLKVDNYAPYKHGDIHKWLAKYPQFQMYGTHALCLASQGKGDPPQDSSG